ncbi:MAG: potassium transporter Kup [Acidimicrobiia bacterium]|nr:potassium transporter Kup [Acidimicrobiia bacterium]
MANESSSARPKGKSPDNHEVPSGSRLVLLTLGAVGIVFGDIGTSVLYAFRESFHGHGLVANHDNVLGVLSLILWSLIIVIAIKYLIFVLRADYDGEGGILALTALVSPRNLPRNGARWLLVMVGIFGTALLYGDGMITPAISVLSAVEGLQVATPFFEPYILPITIAILVGLFAIQSRGTTGIGRIFGPIMVVWFSVLAVLGVRWIVREPSVLAAFNPLHGFGFFIDNGVAGFLVLGSVFLVVTGGEALYADMGHFGTRPIRLAWFVLVFPALMLNYLGQGALILTNPTAAENPFYLMTPDWALYPMVVLATAATVIASQALISGVFSLTRQAVQLGYAPRTAIVHTSEEESGQIYIPGINWLMMVACVGLVIGFRSSSNLAAAYGVAVTATMVITSVLFSVVLRERWRWSPALSVAVTGFFLVIDLGFFGANMVKIPDGGWFPLVVAAGVFLLFTTWKSGRRILGERIREAAPSLQNFLEGIRESHPTRVPSQAVYMYGNPRGAPPALINNLKHNHVIHERVLVVSVRTEERPRVKPADRYEVSPMGDGFYRITLHHGFMQDANVPAMLMHVEIEGERVDIDKVSYFMGRETLLPTDRPGMRLWRERLFALMARNATNAGEFFHLPPDRVVEVGFHVEL